MAILVRCTGCGSAMKVADQYAGKKGKCPKCGGIAQVPKIAQVIKPQRPAAKSPAPAPKPTPTPASLPANIRAPLSPVRPAPRDKKRSAPPPWVWVAGSGGVAVVILLLVGFVKNDSYDSTVPAPTTIASAPKPAAGNTASEEPKPSTAAWTSNRPSPTPGLVSVTASVDMPLDHSRPKIAKTFEEVAHAIVKFEMPLPNGSMITGTGFLIDSRGWVATNHHVASMASTAARVKLNNGRKIEIEGIIALVPERDLAIIKLKELPSDSLLLDIGYRDLPKVGTRVYAYGHPLNNEFSLVEGIVSRVLTTAEFAAQQPDGGNALSRLNAPADQLWIQTDATVSQGNSGGPLLDKNCRVIGVNTFANLDARFGFASHVKYLKALADRSSGEVTPLEQPSELKPPGRPDSSPTPDKPRKITVSKKKLQRLFNAATAFGWQPANQEDYAVMADLAIMMTVCKEPNNKNIPFRLSDLVDQLFARIKQVPWSNEHASAINRYAKEKITPNHGVVFVGTVIGTATGNSGKNSGIIIRVSGVSELFLVPIDKHSLAPSRGTRLMVFGVVRSQTGTANIPNQPKQQPLRFIRSHHTVSM